ncbi:2Fe-2S iron-sulfur cluster-binding protein [Alicyclobacillus sp. SO9]|uniref:2Fe-2S iron-sulfur cluster-binding protein n=1 Tax=Alicyclobacillus sp. SO9 TaxID=2665646 RepID=UPI0018E6DE57|nr:2Fe-2S iron-sulfur cluster-binding protein [Alicyclobacillus sp. SO9]QQE78657.1 (2Fe-2S)-binding protein [Alicyclobacillus sp. SO9]
MAGRIYFKTSGRKIEIGPEGEAHILRTSIRYEGGLPYRCAGGRCGTCRVYVEEGMDNISPVGKAEIDRLGDMLKEGYRLGCQTYAYGDCTLTWDPEQSKLPPLPKLREFWEKRGANTGYKSQVGGT